jgi:hypothetical protein
MELRFLPTPILKNSVGSTSKPVRAMDAYWKQGYDCMVPRKLPRGYGHSLAMKQYREKRDKEHTHVDVCLL